MRWVHALGAAVAATTLVGSVAKATLTTTLVQIPVNATAANTIAPGQAVRTYELRVNQNGEKFNVADLQFNLGGQSNSGLNGYMFAADNHDSTTTGFQHASISYLAGGTTGYAASDPHFYDTSVSTPAYNLNQTAGTRSADLNVAGSADYPVGPGSSTPVGPTSAGNSNGNNKTLNIVWGDQSGNTAATVTDGTAAATYAIARITVVGNTGGFLNGYVVGTGGNTPQNLAVNLYLPILGDVNGDKVVNQADLTVINQSFLSTGPGLAGDINDDGVVNQGDLTFINQSFLNTITPPPGASLGSVVPEPASLALMGLMVVGGLSRRRRA